MAVENAVAGLHGPDVRSDCWVEVRSGATEEHSIDLRSRVAALYGESIRALVESTLAQLGATDVAVSLDDSGALPFVLMARIEAAVRRLRPDTTAAALPPLNPNAVGRSSRERLRRSRLYLPGNTPKFFINAALHAPDAVVLDLEDSVAPAEKDAARILVRNALRAVSFGSAERIVRINQLPQGLDDVRAVAPHGVHTLLIPKVEDAEQVVAVDQLLGEMQAEGLVQHDIYLLPSVESARGVLHAEAIALASPNVVALSIGLEDYAADIGVERTADGRESLWACSQVVNAARAAGVQPLASVYANVDDAQGLRSWVRTMRELGFDGVGCIHPRQVRVVHEVLAPSAAEVDWARKVVAAAEEARLAGRGVVAVDSRMIDAPVVRRALRTLQLAEASGLTQGLALEDEGN